MMRTIRALVLGFAVFAWSLSASAHRVGVPTTSIEWNERTKSWEVVHQLSAHDFEDALELSFDVSALPNEELGELMFDYMQSNFKLFGLMRLQYIGAEIDGDQIWVYYELSGPDWPVIISNRLLFEADATASALVNIKSGPDVQTLIFDFETGWKAGIIKRPRDE